WRQPAPEPVKPRFASWKFSPERLLVLIWQVTPGYRRRSPRFSRVGADGRARSSLTPTTPLLPPGHYFPLGDQATQAVKAAATHAPPEPGKRRAAHGPRDRSSAWTYPPRPPVLWSAALHSQDHSTPPSLTGQAKTRCSETESVLAEILSKFPGCGHSSGVDSELLGPTARCLPTQPCVRRCNR